MSFGSANVVIIFERIEWGVLLYPWQCHSGFRYPVIYGRNTCIFRWFLSEPVVPGYVSPWSRWGADVYFFSELYPIVMACLLWGKGWCRKRILFYCANMSTVEIITKGRSRVPSIMKLVRKMTFQAASHSFVVHAKHIPGVHNGIADSISHYQIRRFRTLAPHVDPQPTPCLNITELLMY